MNIIPRSALTLGLFGLVPFIASALLCFHSDAALSELALRSLMVYAAVILSFLSGVKWGVLLSDTAGDFGSFAPAFVSVVPSILGWGALAFFSDSGALLLLLVGLLLQYLVDSPVAPGGLSNRLPQWYQRLRLILTTGAVLSVAVAWYST